jgi:hypothetical protein
MLTGRSIWINGSFTPVKDAIVTSQTTINGITTQQYINTQGNYNYWFYGSYGLKLKKLDINVGLDLNTEGGRFVNFVNSLKNTTQQSSSGIGLNISRYKEEKYDFSIHAGVKYNRFTSSITEEANTFWNQEHGANFNYFITKRFQVSSNLNFYHREQTDAFTGDNELAVWDASVSYRLFEKKNGVIKLEVNDILKQRRGYDRQVSSQSITERNYNMLGRYALLSFTWNFTKNPGTK